MTDRTEYRKRRFIRRIRKTKRYQALLNGGRISLKDIGMKACSRCKQEKHADTNHFYMKFIDKIDGQYIPYFDPCCKECLAIESKKNGLLYPERQYEESTGMRRCHRCVESKPMNIENFPRARTRKDGSVALRMVCRPCVKEETKDYSRRTAQTRKSARNKHQREYQARRRKRDPVYKIRKYTSTAIYRALKEHGGGKNGRSITDVLPYTADDLKIHIESLFEPWMNWTNIGRYNPKTWNDNDSNTWVWNVDHITPQYLLPYDSMDSENFKRCWALENLRPYSAKLNVIEGNKMSRSGRKRGQ